MARERTRHIGQGPHGRWDHVLGDMRGQDVGFIVSIPFGWLLFGISESLGVGDLT